MRNDFIDEEDEDDFRDKDKEFNMNKAKRNFKRGYQKEFNYKKSNNHVPKKQEVA